MVNGNCCVEKSNHFVTLQTLIIRNKPKINIKETNITRKDNISSYYRVYDMYNLSNKPFIIASLYCPFMNM